MANLFKSRIISYRQCPKRLWLEIHKPEERDDSASEMSFKIGNKVGDVARIVFDPENTGVIIDIKELGHSQAIAESAQLLADGTKPIFEAGLNIPGLMAYADVMLPNRNHGVLQWDMIEVKSSTSVKDYYRDDVAVQAYIAEQMGLSLSSVGLAYINNDYIHQEDLKYQGLFTLAELTEETKARSSEVAEWVAGAYAVADLVDEPEIEMGNQCYDPFTCSFCAYCSKGIPQAKHPVSWFPRLSGKRKAALDAAGISEMSEVDDDFLNLIQQRVRDVTVSGETYFDSKGAAEDLAPYGYPAYFLDFETAMFAVPIWNGTRPFQQLPFQFSVHTLQEDGSLIHYNFLDLSGNDPSQSCAKALVDQCGVKGPIFAYNAGFEKGVMCKLAERFPEYAQALENIIGRVVDLLPIARNRYYHPSQQGSWSLKAVLPAAIPELSYAQLVGVQNGSMAVDAYMEAITPGTTTERKQELYHQLNEYCKLDTFAMVKLWEFFLSKH